jgi:hypothetical protein
LIRLDYAADGLEISINESFACYNQMAKPINWTSTAEKLEHKLGKLL